MHILTLLSHPFGFRISALVLSLVNTVLLSLLNLFLCIVWSESFFSFDLPADGYEPLCGLVNCFDCILIVGVVVPALVAAFGCYAYRYLGWFVLLDLLMISSLANHSLFNFSQSGASYLSWLDSAQTVYGSLQRPDTGALVSAFTSLSHSGLVTNYGLLPVAAIGVGQRLALACTKSSCPFGSRGLRTVRGPKVADMASYGDPVPVPGCYPVKSSGIPWLGHAIQSRMPLFSTKFAISGFGPGIGFTRKLPDTHSRWYNNAYEMRAIVGNPNTAYTALQFNIGSSFSQHQLVLGTGSTSVQLVSLLFTFYLKHSGDFYTNEAQFMPYYSMLPGDLVWLNPEFINERSLFNGPINVNHRNSCAGVTMPRKDGHPDAHCNLAWSLNQVTFATSAAQFPEFRYQSNKAEADAVIDLYNQPGLVWHNAFDAPLNRYAMFNEQLGYTQFTSSLAKVKAFNAALEPDHTLDMC